MARYTGPKSKIARKFGEPIFGTDKAFEKKNYPPGAHGQNKRRRKPSEYGIQLKEKQKVKYTYGILERQFANLFNICLTSSCFLISKVSEITSACVFERICSSSDSSFSERRPVITRSKSFLASTRAVALPMPELAPVTNAMGLMSGGFQQM